MIKCDIRAQDYGMVRKQSIKDRHTVAKLVLALNHNDKATAACIYRENGCKATLSDGIHVDDSILHLLATLHLDKIDLSKLTLDNGNNIDLLESVHARMGSAFLEGGISRFFQGICVQAAHS